MIIQRTGFAVPTMAHTANLVCHGLGIQLGKCGIIMFIVDTVYLNVNPSTPGDDAYVQ